MYFAAVGMGVLFHVDLPTACPDQVHECSLGVDPLCRLLVPPYQDHYLQVCLLVLLDQVVHGTKSQGHHYHFQTVLFVGKSGLHFYRSSHWFLEYVLFGVVV